MTELELLSLIAAGESETVEFKREMDRAALDFDLSPVPRASLADLNTDLIEEYVHSKLGISLAELPVDLTQQLTSWKILVEQMGERRVTFTGMLFFGDQPGDFLPQARLWLKRFKGLTGGATND